MSTIGNPFDAVSERMREAASKWAQIPVKTRVRYMEAVRYQIVVKQDELIETVSSETRKPVSEVANQEVTAVLAMLRFIEKKYPGWLRDIHFRTITPGFWTKTNTISFDPLGILAVIGPANFPFSLVMIQTAAAIACGNGVVMKPSERCPKTARIIRQLFVEAGLPDHVVEVVEGPAETARQIIAHPSVTKVIFTGSSETGSRIAELCGKYFKPCILELGGDGPAIVCEEADLELATRGILWSTLYANGASCIGTRRVLVLSNIARAFEQALRAVNQNRRIGDPDDPNTEVEPAHTLLLDVSQDTESPLAEQGASIKEQEPAPARMQGVRLTLQVVSSLEQAIQSVNESKYGLSASVWCKDTGKARRIAHRLRVGMVWVNDASVALPKFPWGGVRHSGWGRLFSREALPELTNLKVVSHDHRRTALSKFWWFPYSTTKFEMIKALNALLYGPKRCKVFLRFLTAIRLYLVR